MTSFTRRAAAIAAAVTMTLASTSALAGATEEVRDREANNARTKSCELVKVDKFGDSLASLFTGDKATTRNEAYAKYLEVYKLADLTDQEREYVAAVAADRAAECGVVSFPITERITTFLGSSGAGSAGLSAGDMKAFSS